MSKWLRKEAAKACPVHQIVTDAAADALVLHGAFSKDQILNDANLTAMSDAIRWDYIREFLQDQQGCELVPLASSYFKRHKTAHEHANPERYLAMGHGKKTMGYAAVIAENDHLVVARTRYKKAMANGVGEALMNYIAVVEAKRATYIGNDTQEAPAISKD